MRFSSVAQAKVDATHGSSGHTLQALDTVMLDHVLHRRDTQRAPWIARDEPG